MSCYVLGQALQCAKHLHAHYVLGSKDFYLNTSCCVFCQNFNLSEEENIYMEQLQVVLSAFQTNKL